MLKYLFIILLIKNKYINKILIFPQCRLNFPIIVEKFITLSLSKNKIKNHLLFMFLLDSSDFVLLDRCHALFLLQAPFDLHFIPYLSQAQYNTLLKKQHKLSNIYFFQSTFIVIRINNFILGVYCLIFMCFLLFITLQRLMDLC